ncbi:unnamed protein product, partial [Phaeothamnion confervicola]
AGTVLELETGLAERIQELAVAAHRAKQLEGQLSEAAEELHRLRRQRNKLESVERKNREMEGELRQLEATTGVSTDVGGGLEFTEHTGDLSPDEEKRLIEELSQARDEMKNMRLRQAMVTHELLGKLSSANAGTDALRAQLEEAVAAGGGPVSCVHAAGGILRPLAAFAPHLAELTREVEALSTANASLAADLASFKDGLVTLVENAAAAFARLAGVKAAAWDERELARLKTAAGISGGAGGGPRPSGAGGGAGRPMAAATAAAANTTAGAAGAGASGTAASAGAVSASADSTVPQARSSGAGRVSSEATDDGRWRSRAGDPEREARLARLRAEKQTKEAMRRRTVAADEAAAEALRRACDRSADAAAAFLAQRAKEAVAACGAGHDAVYADLLEALRAARVAVAR